MIIPRLFRMFFFAVIILCTSLYCSKKQSNTSHQQNKTDEDKENDNADQDTIIDDRTDTSSLSVNAVNEKCSMLQPNENPSQTCVQISQCNDISENNSGWIVNVTNATVTVATNSTIFGKNYLHLTNQTGKKAIISFSLPKPHHLSIENREEIRFFFRATRSDMPYFEKSMPTVTLIDRDGSRRTYEPRIVFEDDVIHQWKYVALPLYFGLQKVASPIASSNFEVADNNDSLKNITSIEFHLSNWNQPFSFDIDGLTITQNFTQCNFHCPNSCVIGTCNPNNFTCECDLGAQGVFCNSCSDGFSKINDECINSHNIAFDYWPNEISNANSDEWLVEHHQDIKVLHPKVLVLHYVNKSNIQQTEQKIQEIFTAFSEASKYRGYEDLNALPQLEYQIAKIVDLRDGVENRPSAPENYPYENSSLYPRRKLEYPEFYSIDYRQFFTDEYAKYYGYVKPNTTSSITQYYNLCELIDSGEIHDLWIVGSGDVPDAGAAEVLEYKQKYSFGRNKIFGEFEPCAGNGCFEENVTPCNRSVRIGFVNYNRGPGCYMESLGHGLEWTGNNNVIPPLTQWFRPYGGFNLDWKYGLPFSSVYAMGCDTPPCFEYYDPETASFNYNNANYIIQPFDAVCGNVHYPPNGRSDYDIDSVIEVLSSCEYFGKTYSRSLVSNANWKPYFSLAGDCDGAFLVWWYQNMPGYNTGHVFPDGRPMLSLWPFLYY